MSTSSDAARAIAEAARTIHQSRSLGQTLQSIAEAARTSVPGFDQVGISVIRRNGQIETKAATGDLVLRLDEIQYGLGEGPCVETLRDAHVVSAPHLSHDRRWPQYVPRAVEHGLKSQLAVQLYLDDEGTLGGLNLYSTQSEDLHPDAEDVAELFAAHAAIALGHARERETLNDALHSRKTIGQAIGILMERYQMNDDRAFAFLVRASSTGNMKLRDIAQEIVDQGNTR